MPHSLATQTLPEAIPREGVSDDFGVKGSIGRGSQPLKLPCPASPPRLSPRKIVRRMMPGMPPSPTTFLEGNTTVSQMNESAAEKLDPAQAAELVQVLDLQARWENLWDDRTRDGSDHSTPLLQGLQLAFEAFRSRMAEYTARYRTAQIPDLSPSGPDRLAGWCRAVRAIFQRAGHETGGDCPVHVVAKAHRLADRIAARVKNDPVRRGSPPDDIAGAIRDLGAIIAWCDGLVAPSSPIGSMPLPQGEIPKAGDEKKVA